MTPIIFATNNQHKVDEIHKQLGNQFQIITLKEAGINIDIPEPHDSLEANASEKSGVIEQLTGKNCFSEDTGLEVFELGGEPGVKSARYAGENRSSDDNITKLLQRLDGSTNRKAQFRTVISLRLNGKEFLFEGICAGTIATERKGEEGFGYDPVFVPEGDIRSFAQMTTEEKAEISHRGKAVRKLIEFLNKIT